MIYNTSHNVQNKMQINNIISKINLKNIIKENSIDNLYIYIITFKVLCVNFNIFWP